MSRPILFSALQHKSDLYSVLNLTQKLDLLPHFLPPPHYLKFLNNNLDLSLCLILSERGTLATPLVLLGTVQPLQVRTTLI